jgi:hypothetical protein
VSGSVTERHDAVVQSLAERYRQDGYSVDLEPHIADRSGRAVHPDLIARRGAQTVLVEARMVTSARSEPILRQLSEIAHEHGWKFVIVIVNEDRIEEVEIPSPAEIRAKLREAEAVANSSSASATLLAWSAFEAAARLYLTRYARRLTRPTSPRTLIQQLASLGAFDVEEEKMLAAFTDQRNRMAHGMWTTDKPVGLNRVIQIAERLVDTDPLQTAG